MTNGSPSFTWNFSDCWVTLPDSATATQLCRRFHQCALRLPLPGRLSTVPNITSSLRCSSSQTLLINFVITAEHCSLCIHTDIRSKFCLLYWTESKLPRLLDTVSKFALFLVSGLEDKKLIKKSKPTWKLKHANSILETFEYFCQMSSKLIIIISSYTVSKLGRFFETQCSSVRYDTIRYDRRV